MRELLMMTAAIMALALGSQASSEQVALMETPPALPALLSPF